jgi:DNA-directed RNA polymerase specialized sigma24 family protein
MRSAAAAGADVTDAWGLTIVRYAGTIAGVRYAEVQQSVLPVMTTVSSALQSLSAEHRTAVIRAYYLAQTVPEIARLEQLPEETVKCRLHDALHTLARGIR